MNSVRITSTPPWAAWLGTGIAAAFCAWCLLAGTNDMREPAMALAHYPMAFGIGLATSSLLAIGVRFTAAASLMPALAVAMLACYAAAFRVVAGDAALLATIALVAVALWFSLRGRPHISGSLLITLHAQGTLGGLYLAARVEDQLAGWPGFVDAMRALAMLIF